MRGLIDHAGVVEHRLQAVVVGEGIHARRPPVEAGIAVAGVDRPRLRRLRRGAEADLGIVGAVRGLAIQVAVEKRVNDFRAPLGESRGALRGAQRVTTAAAGGGLLTTLLTLAREVTTTPHPANE